MGGKHKTQKKRISRKAPKTQAATTALNELQTPVESQRVRSVFRSPLEHITRIWAEHGMVHVEADGQVRSWRPKQMGYRIRTLSNMMRKNWDKMSSDYKDRMIRMIEDATRAVREALHMEETLESQSSMTRSAINLMHNRMPNGRPITMADIPEQLLIQRYRLMFSELDEREIAAVLRSSYPEKVKEDMMNVKHMDRMRERMRTAPNPLIIPGR